MNFYTNVSPYGDELLVRYFDNGKRCEDRVPYVPRLFVPTKGKGRFKSLTGVGLDSVSYKSIKEARQTIKRYEEHPNFLHGTDRFQYQYMADYWPGNVEYDKDKLRIYTIDIEVESEHGFPNVADCAEKMICITVKDQVKKQILVWGMADYTVKQDNVHYVKCNDERDLLKQFLKFWSAYSPDVLTGWNSKYFDIPYLVKRIGKILGDSSMKRMSPWNIIQEDQTYELLSYRKPSHFGKKRSLDKSKVKQMQEKT